MAQIIKNFEDARAASPFVFGHMVSVKRWQVCGSCGNDLPKEWWVKRYKLETPDEIMDDNLYIDCDDCVLMHTFLHQPTPDRD